MREHALLSPHRARQRGEAAHDRRIITEAPNIMWAIDATQITTVQDGKVWLFGVAEHWNAELLGWHVSKRGTRFEAIQALGMAVRQQFGRLSAGAARGVAVRHDHGSNFMADDFQRQARFWGLAPSYAFVSEPETNGVIERLFRTLKEQAVHGRVFQTIDEVRGAIRAFADLLQRRMADREERPPQPARQARRMARLRPSGAPHSATYCPENRVRPSGLCPASCRRLSRIIPASVRLQGSNGCS